MFDPRFWRSPDGDIPSFLKTDSHEREEEKAIETLLSTLPAQQKEEFTALFAEMAAMESPEAKLFKALDNMEAVLSHNEAPLSTWIPMEFEENLIYGQKNCQWSPWTKGLREELRKDSVQKIEKETSLPRQN